MIKKLYAVCLLVEDFERSLTFYRDILGLKIHSQDNKYTDFKLGETLLGIFQKDEATAMFSTEHMNRGGGSVLAFQVDNVEESCSELQAKGITVFDGPKKTSWGQTVAYFKDPDENIWEVTS